MLLGVEKWLSPQDSHLPLGDQWRPLPLGAGEEGLLPLAGENGLPPFFPPVLPLESLSLLEPLLLPFWSGCITLAFA